MMEMKKVTTTGIALAKHLMLRDMSIFNFLLISVQTGLLSPNGLKTQLFIIYFLTALPTGNEEWNLQVPAPLTMGKNAGLFTEEQ